MHHPRRLRPDLEGAFGIVERTHLVAVAQRLRDQPAQAEERHLVVLEHGVERLLRASRSPLSCAACADSSMVSAGSESSVSALRACFCASAPSPAATAANPCVSER